jgi:hypothetical protein
MFPQVIRAGGGDFAIEDAVVVDGAVREALGSPSEKFVEPSHKRAAPMIANAATTIRSRLTRVAL